MQEEGKKLAQGKHTLYTTMTKLQPLKSMNNFFTSLLLQTYLKHEDGQKNPATWNLQKRKSGRITSNCVLFGDP